MCVVDTRPARHLLRTSLQHAANSLTSPFSIGALERAASANDAARWSATRDIADARNAHRTNTARELLAALEGPFDALEGDVRTRDGGRIVMAHGRDDAGLTLDQWLDLGHRSGRALKLDFKDQASIIPAIERAHGRGIRGTHLVINVDAASTSAATLARIRELYPTAWVNLSPRQPYDASVLTKLAAKARRVGGNVQFPLRWDLVTPEIIRALRSHGRIAIWNDPPRTPDDLVVERRRLRAMGVDGTIDLRRS